MPVLDHDDQPAGSGPAGCSSNPSANGSDSAFDAVNHTADDVDEYPAVSVAVAVAVCGPLDSDAELTVTLYGAAVAVPSRTPST